ncbi:MAG: hypothetical protein ABGZ53_31035 [Fuerstiella sp.]
MPTAFDPEKLVTLDHARKHLIPSRGDGRPIDPSTLWRWIRRGLSGVDGARIKLVVVYCGNRPHVTAQALDSFFKAITAAKLARHRRAEALAADATTAELQAAGLQLRTPTKPP